MNPSFLIAQADVASRTPAQRIVHIAKPQDGQAVTVQLREASTLEFTAVATQGDHAGRSPWSGPATGWSCCSTIRRP